MLRSKALIPLLSQLNTQGVKCTMLLTVDGRLLAYTSAPELFDTDRTVASVAAHAFTEYQTTARSSFDRPHALEFLLFELEEGRLALTPVHDRYLLCCYTDNTAEIGSVKMKLEAARRDLYEPLARVGAADADAADAGTATAAAAPAAAAAAPAAGAAGGAAAGGSR